MPYSSGLKSLRVRPEVVSHFSTFVSVNRKKDVPYTTLFNDRVRIGYSLQGQSGCYIVGQARAFENSGQVLDCAFSILGVQVIHNKESHPHVFENHRPKGNPNFICVAAVNNNVTIGFQNLMIDPDIGGKIHFNDAINSFSVSGFLNPCIYILCSIIQNDVCACGFGQRCFLRAANRSQNLTCAFEFRELNCILGHASRTTGHKNALALNSSINVGCVVSRQCRNSKTGSDSRIYLCG